MHVENLSPQIPTILEKRERERTKCACAEHRGQIIALGGEGNVT